MAHRIDPTVLPARVEYNWDELLDGSTWQLRHGKDFTCAPDSFVHLARKRARARGKRVQGAIGDDKSVLIRAY